jgi:hypothetical protein
MKIITLAFVFRVILYFSLCLIYPHQNIGIFSGTDDREYFYMANNNLQVLPDSTRQFQYTHWYQRTPIYTLFLYVLTPQIALFVQMFIGSIGVWLMWKMNKWAGFTWNVWECGYDMIYFKESLLFALIIFIIYLFSKK